MRGLPSDGSGYTPPAWPRAIALAALLFSGCGGDPPSAPTPGPPTLRCPANVSVSGVLGGSQAVTYAAPVPSGGSPPVATSCAPASGATFPVGSTPVTCTATDALNRQATCGFTVTLTAQQLAVSKFVAFGDSVTAGEDGRRLRIRVTFIDPVRAYPAVLQSLLRRDFPGQTAIVVNEGRGGVRAKDDVDRLDDVLKLHAPEVLLLLHGYNDLLNEGTRGVDEVVIALRDMVRMARAQGVRFVFVSTLTPSRPATGRFNRTIDPQAILQANGRLIPMALGEGARVVDAFGTFLGREQELVEEDGLHLTAAGNQVLAEAFYAAIRAAGVVSALAARPVF